MHVEMYLIHLHEVISHNQVYINEYSKDLKQLNQGRLLNIDDNNWGVNNEALKSRFEKRNRLHKWNRNTRIKQRFTNNYHLFINMNYQ